MHGTSRWRKLLLSSLGQWLRTPAVTEHDPLHATRRNGVDPTLAQQHAWHQQMAAAVAQLTQAVAENAGHAAHAAATTMASQDAVQATTMNSLGASLAQQDAWN